MNRQKKKQMTLAQTWESKKASQAARRQNNVDVPLDIVDLCASDDELDNDLLRYVEEAERRQSDQSPCTSTSLQRPTNALYNGENLPGFDLEAGQTWIYPTNYPVRDYQYSIVEKALFSNTLVVLPTGLGKTFIAATVMYNFFRWYPMGKVVFTAHTKPLVAQQIEACYYVVGLPQNESCELTGSISPEKRKQLWRSKRVFFLTPHVMINDLTRGACPASDVKLIVVDEAHKASKNYAYCQVVEEIRKHTSQFRILALSATPGSNAQAVNDVITNLLISHVEIRTEDSPDIKPYTFDRKVEQIIVPLGDKLTSISEKFLEVFSIYINRLHSVRVLFSNNAKMFSKFLLLKAREEFRLNPPADVSPVSARLIEGDFAISISFSHAYDLLILHGMRCFYHFLSDILEGSKCTPRTRAELLRNGTISGIMSELEEKFSADASDSPQADRVFTVSHPKQEKLLEIVLDHFKQTTSGEDSSDSTRVMIFSQFRDSVQEITQLLKQHRPLIRVMSFTGHSSVNKRSKGLNQKEQLEIVKQFREGGFNTLVATCVAEEGLDIGEVDLIVCYDSQKSPIRLVQRMGRTGRKRDGRIVMLITEGKEYNTFKRGDQQKTSIHKSIIKGVSHSDALYAGNPRMVPAGLEPICEKIKMVPQAKYKAKTKKASEGKSKKTSSRSLHNGSIENCFAEMSLKKGKKSVLSSFSVEIECSDEEKIRRKKKYIDSSDDELLLKDPFEIEKISFQEETGYVQSDMDDDSCEPDHDIVDQNHVYKLDDDDDQLPRSVVEFFPLRKRNESNMKSDEKPFVVRTPPHFDDVFPSSTQNLSPVDVRAIVCDGSRRHDDDDYGPEVKSDSVMDEFKDIDDAFWAPMTGVDGMATESCETSSSCKEAKVKIVDKSRENDDLPHADDDCEELEYINAFQEAHSEDLLGDDLLGDGYCTEAYDEDDEADGVRSPVFDAQFGLSDEVFLENAEQLEKNANTSTSLCSLTQLVELVEMDTENFSHFDDDSSRPRDVNSIGTNARAVINDLKPARNCGIETKIVLKDDEIVTQEFEVLDSPSGNSNLKRFSPVKGTLSSREFVHRSDVGNFKITLEMSDEESSVVPPGPSVARKSSQTAAENEKCKARNPFLKKIFTTAISRMEPKPTIGSAASVRSTSLLDVSPINPRIVELKSVDSAKSTSSMVTSTPVVFKQHRLNAPCAIVAPMKRGSPESPVTPDQDDLVPFKRKNKRAILSDSPSQRIPIQNRVSNDRRSKRVINEPKLRRKRLLNKFIDNEAVLSDDSCEVSEDEMESNGKSQFEGSFIDDQPVEDENWEEVYLQPSASPVNPFKFKMATNVARNMDVYSQEEVDQESEYVLDSFCIDDDVECENNKRRWETETTDDDVFKPSRKKAVIVISDDESLSPVRPSKKARSNITADEPGPSRTNNTFGKKDSPKSIDITNEKESPAMPVTATTANSSFSGSLTVFVDSREISGAQAIVSNLRHQHKVNPIVTQLTGCDYVVSSRMAVERKLFSDIQKVTNRKQLVERIREMTRLFERACLIIEYDRNYEECKLSVPRRNNYFDTMTCALLQLPLKVLYSDCQSDTASLLHSLAKREQTKGFGFSVSTKLEPSEESIMKLYQLLPDVNYVNALYLCKNFNSLRHLCNSNVMDIAQKGQMSEEKARTIVNFFQESFEDA